MREVRTTHLQSLGKHRRTQELWRYRILVNTRRTRGISARYSIATSVGTDIVAFIAGEKISAKILAITTRKSAARHLRKNRRYKNSVIKGQRLLLRSEGTEKVDYTVYIWYNVSIKYRRCFYDRTTAEIDAKSIHGNI